nr:glycosyltransferase family 2 protein [uncultured Dialister sp.]
MTGIVVSIIVPVYKAEKYLKKCLNTLVHQTATNYEVLLIDDGSPDNSGKICDSYAGTHGFVYSIRKIRELPGLVKRL